MIGVESGGPRRARAGRRELAAALVALAIGATSCAAVSPSSLDSPTGLVAPPGEILVPPCPASAACLGGFVVGETLYGISCHGVEPTAVTDETLARGSGTYQEARVIEGVPPHLWLAVRGDVPCRPASDAPLHYEWYLARGESTQAEFEEWGRRVADLTLPLTPAASASPGP